MGNVSTSFEITSVQQNDNKLLAMVSLNEKNELFEGHFPNNPIMPGVLNIEILEKILDEKLKKQIKQINQIKFLKPVVPNQNEPLEYKLEVSIKPENRTIVSVIGTIKDDVFVKIQLEIEPKV